MVSKSDQSKPTAAELDVLSVLWQLGPATAKQVHQAMLADRPDVSYANVLRFLQIMHAKGLLLRDESERSHVYTTAQSRDAMQTSIVQDLINKVFAGSGKALVMAALRGHVSQAERAEIEDLLHGEEE